MSLIGKEAYVIHALTDQFRYYVSDITYSGYEEEDQTLLFEARNLVANMPCLLKTNGKTLWLHLEEDNWATIGEYELNSYIPMSEEAVFLDHFDTVSLIEEYDFSKKDLIDLLGVLYSQRKMTKEHIQEELDSAKEIFSLSNEKTNQNS